MVSHGPRERKSVAGLLGSVLLRTHVDGIGKACITRSDPPMPPCEGGDPLGGAWCTPPQAGSHLCDSQCRSRRCGADPPTTVFSVGARVQYRTNLARSWDDVARCTETLRPRLGPLSKARCKAPDPGACALVCLESGVIADGKCPQRSDQRAAIAQAAACATAVLWPPLRGGPDDEKTALLPGRPHPRRRRTLLSHSLSPFRSRLSRSWCGFVGAATSCAEVGVDEALPLLCADASNIGTPRDWARACSEAGFWRSRPWPRAALEESATDAPRTLRLQGVESRCQRCELS